MTTKPQPSTRTAAPVQAAGAPNTAESALEKIARELHDRYPNRLIKRFVMPARVRECREVFMIELTSRDEVKAAIMAEQAMSQIERISYRLANDAQNREQVRVAIVAIGSSPGGGEVFYRHVNHDGVPLIEIDSWSQTAWAALYAYNGNVNGIPLDELKSGIEASCAVGAFATPQTNETPKNA